MIPKLSTSDIQDRISKTAKVATGEYSSRLILKKQNNGTTSVERKLKQKIGKLMKSKSQPKINTVEVSDASRR